jgi:broad specificity phosphatase PhoE
MLDPPLAPLGTRQGEAVRDVLAAAQLKRVYSSPLRRSVQTASIAAAPHGLTPEPVQALVEADLGRWEGLDWETIRTREPEEHARFLASLAHPGGESYREVQERASAAIEDLLNRHRDEVVLVVSHHVVLRTYLAGLLGLPPERARELSIPNASISTVVREGGQTRILTIADTRHLEQLDHEAC